MFASDACMLNFMMDATRVCPKGFHFAHKLSVDGVHYKLPSRYRCCVTPVLYYIINFESSKKMEEGRDNAAIIRARCQIKTVPEFQPCIPYNPFKLDVYNFGTTFLMVCDEYNGLDDLRPNTTEALKLLDEFVAFKGKLWLRGRVWSTKPWGKPPPLFLQSLWQKFPILLKIPFY
ncbi:hypothetical protein IW261DRAFT_1420787 [Armillaria novae-zelandiae]|uniref:Uncharacterized protein n=1 Tax=Armillaria novae-zelandiae TaxID=153914 RepID=A0AA39UGI5_9AGAR|nr:hypothetical protein IW261DRAFT_1420787 [Armillaria novae-zelandiae]